MASTIEFYGTTQLKSVPQSGKIDVTIFDLF